jgi:hypothetical protein
MAVEDRLDDFVSEKAFQQFEQVKQDVKDLIELMAELSKTARAAFSDLGSSKTFDDLTNSAKKANDANQQVNQSQLDFQKLVAETEGFLKQFGGTMEQNIKLYLSYKTELKNIQSEVSDLTKATDVYGGSLNRNTERLIELTKREGELKAAMSEVKIMLNAENKERIAASDSIDAMSQRLGRLRDIYRQLNAEDRNSAIGTGIKQQIRDLDAEVKKLDADIGNFQRNVGNYPNASAQLSAIKNEMIGMAAAGKQDSAEFQALRIKAEELGASISAVNGELKQQTTIGDKVTSMFERMGLRFIISMGIFQAGISLINAVEERWKRNTDELNIAQTTASEIAKNSANNFSQEAIELEALKARFLDATTTMDDKKAIVQQLNTDYADQIEKIKGVNDAERFFVDKTPYIIQALTLRAQAEGALATIRSNAQKEIEAEANPEELLTGWDKAAIAIKAFSKEITTFSDKNIIQKFKDEFDWQKVVEGAGRADQILTNLRKSNDLALQQFIDLSNKASAAAKAGGINLDPGKKPPKGKKPLDLTDAELKSQIDLTKELAKTRAEGYLVDAEANRLIYEDDTQTLEKRLEAWHNYQDLKRAAIIETAQAEIKASREKLDKISEIENIDPKKRTRQQIDLLLEKPAISQSLDTDKEKLNLSLLKNQEETAKGAKKIADEEVAYQLSLVKKIAQNNDYYKNLELQQLREGHNALLESEEEYQKKRQEIIHKYNQKNFSETKDYLLGILEANKDNGANLTKVDDAISANSQKSSDEQVSYDDKKRSLLEKGQNELKEKTIELAKQAIDTIQTMKDNAFAQEELDLQYQERQDQLYYQNQINAVNATIGNQIDKQKKLNQLSAESAAQQNALAAKEKELSIKRAIGDKEAAEGKVAGSTAEGIMKVWAEYGDLPALAAALSAVVAAIGVEQFAAVASTPIPQYKFGTKDKPHEGGLAVVGDGGEKELISEPGKAPYWSSETPELRNLAKGTHVIPLHDINSFASKNILKTMVIPLKGADNSKLEKEVEGLRGDVRQLTFIMQHKQPVIINNKPSWWGDYAKTVFGR